MKSQQAHSCTFSFEFFPPRSEKGIETARATADELARLQPAFYSVTFGAGGSAQSGTFETVTDLQQRTGVPVAAHISCIGTTADSIRDMLDRYREAGIDRLVALRGDLPEGGDGPGDFSHASDLVAFIRAETGDHFHIEVAAYPESHPESPDPDADLEHFVSKINAGADSAITQYFFNADAYFDFVDRAEAAGVTVPIVPGIMPITNYRQLARFSDACGAEIPRWIRLKLQAWDDDLDSIRAFGVEVVAKLCRELLDAGAPGLHFYCLNRADAVTQLWRELGLPEAIAADVA